MAAAACGVDMAAERRIGFGCLACDSADARLVVSAVKVVVEGTPAPYFFRKILISLEFL
jgi:hypothetical protein